MSPSLSAPDRKVSWTELFFDLVFVAAVSQVGAPLAAHYSFPEVGRFAFLLLVIWWAWHGYAVYATRFDTDDSIERAATLLQMIAVIFMAANAEEGLDSDSSAGFAAAYAVMRLILVARYVRSALRGGSPALARDHAVGFGVAAVLWLASALIPLPWRYWCWAMAFSIDVGAAIMASRHDVAMPPHASHLPERFGLFTLILLGEAVVAIMSGIQQQPEWSVEAASTALSGIVVISVVWWGYFDGVGAAGHRPVRCVADSHRLWGWSAAHVVLYLGVALFGIAAEHAIRDGGWQSLHGQAARLSAGSVMLVVTAFVLLRAVTPQTLSSTPGRLAHQ